MKSLAFPLYASRYPKPASFVAEKPLYNGKSPFSADLCLTGMVMISSTPCGHCSRFGYVMVNICGCRQTVAEVAKIEGQLCQEFIDGSASAANMSKPYLLLCFLTKQTTHRLLIDWLPVAWPDPSRDFQL